jgi:transcription initiation factor TFIID TATA-box-binding protein
MRKRKYSSLPSSTTYTPEQGTPLPVVHNIVATSKITSSIPVLNLHKIHALLPFSFYDQNKFAAITVRLHRPDCTTLLFSSGKLVVTGCRTWYQCVYASLFITDLLRQCTPGHEFVLTTCDVQNMVAHVETPVGEGYLDLHSMYSQMAINCTYQRKMFPGLIYRPESSPVVLLCFFSGKIVITGGKNMQDVYAGWNRLWPVLKRFIVPNHPPSLPVAAGSNAKRGFNRRALFHRREGDKSLPLERDTVAGDPVGSAEHLVQDSRGDLRRHCVLDLAKPPELQGLGDDLAAEGHTLGLRALVGATGRREEPG